MGQGAGGMSGQIAVPARGADEPEVIEAEIEQTRADLSATVDAIQQRIDPEQAKDSARELAEHVLQEAKEHAREIIQEAGEHAREAVKDATAHVQQAVHDATIGRVQKMVHSAHGRANEASEGIMTTIRQNPVPAALAGIGLAWLWMNRRNSSSHRATYYDAQYSSGASYNNPPMNSGYRPQSHGEGIAGRVGQAVGGAASTVGDTAGSVAGAVGDTAGSVASTIGDTAGNVASAVGDTASNLVGAVGDTASSVEDRFQGALRSNPLAVGAVALAVGAAVGLALPQTERENQLLGEARDSLVGKAQELAQETVEKVQSVASEAGQTVQQEAQKQGLAH